MLNEYEAKKQIFSLGQNDKSIITRIETRPGEFIPAELAAKSPCQNDKSIITRIETWLHTTHPKTDPHEGQNDKSIITRIETPDNPPLIE